MYKNIQLLSDTQKDKKVLNKLKKEKKGVIEARSSHAVLLYIGAHL